MPQSDPTTHYVLVQLHDVNVRSPLERAPVNMPPGVVGVLPVYRTLVELHREHGVEAKYAELVIGGGDGT